MKRLALICIALLCIIPFAVFPVQALIKVDPTYEWQTFGGTEQQPLANAFDGNLATYAQWGTTYNQGMIKLTFPVGTNLTEMRYYEKDHADDHYLITEANWTYDPAKTVSAGGTTYNAWENRTINSGNGYITSAPLYYRGGAWWLETAELEFWASSVPPPIANFTGAPLEAVAPEYVSFTDTSTNEIGTCTYNWSFSPMDGILTAPTDLDNEDITVLFTQNGNFTVSHGVSCAAGSDIETKSDYVHIVNASELATFRIRAVDAVSGYGINGATVSAYDIENASWANQTTTTGEVSVTALTGHTANAYGTASGYDDGESLALPVYQGALYPIYMYPSNFGRNASAGNVTLYITVLEEGTNTRLPGMAVSLSASGGGASYTAGTTNDNGIFQIVVPNQTTYLVSVLKQKGYLGASKSVYTGTQSGGDAYVEETIWLQKDSVTPTVTATTLPGGGTPTPVQTVDPYPCDADHPENCQRKQTEMGNLLVAWGPRLMMFFLLLTFVGGFKLIGKR